MPRKLLVLGGYVPRDTLVHGIDARVKLVCLLAATVAVFSSSTLWSIGFASVVLAVTLAAARVSVADVARAMRPAVVILAFALLANSFVADGTADVALVGSFGLSLAGLARGAFAVTRIVLLVAFSLVVCATTTPPQLTSAASALLRPLGALGVPVDDIAMVVSVTLRFIPVCAEEFDGIAAAQRARGVRFDEGSLVERVSRWASVLIPLVVKLFRRADVLAEAMRDRCYRGQGRTHLATRLGRLDVLVLVGGVAFAVCCVIV
ncbi:MAG: energy-coupling factor transporter transmembrane protein EcfT [Atopobiaceae bacterium]|jgi:energy-coupling factor transporter transmembrane protein EcfT|nr:energy-coupling factor transporter transmembrane protein EcfT [Atopobiaceae bacterium]